MELMAQGCTPVPASASWTAPMPFFVRPVAKGIASKVRSSYFGPSLASHRRLLEAHLDEREYFVGDSLSAADVQMSFPLETMVHGGRAEAGHPDSGFEAERSLVAASFHWYRGRRTQALELAESARQGFRHRGRTNDPGCSGSGQHHRGAADRATAGG